MWLDIFLCSPAGGKGHQGFWKTHSGFFSIFRWSPRKYNRCMLLVTRVKYYGVCVRASSELSRWTAISTSFPLETAKLERNLHIRPEQPLIRLQREVANTTMQQKPSQGSKSYSLRTKGKKKTSQRGLIYPPTENPVKKMNYTSLTWRLRGWWGEGGDIQENHRSRKLDSLSERGKMS